MLRRCQSKELYKRYLHSQQSAQYIEDVVSSNDTVEISLFFGFVCNQSEEYKDGYDVDNEGVSTPRCHHEEVGERGANRPYYTSSVAGAKEYVEGEH